MPNLGRIPVIDSRDLSFPMSLLLDTVDFSTLPTSRIWPGPTFRVDQDLVPDSTGGYGSCVGFAGANWRGATPVRDQVSNQDGLNLYAACKQYDGFPNQEGSNDRALAKVLVSLGLIDRYLWAQDAAHIKAWVLSTGPVLVGADWYTGMDNYDSRYVMHATGQIRGGHEFLVNGFLSGYYRIRNSWGQNWGQMGEAWLPEADLYRLVFQQDGDALGAVEHAP